MKRFSVLLMIAVFSVINNPALGKNTKQSDAQIDLLSSASIFKPLVADSRWPRFSMGYHYYTKGSFGRQGFAANFGAVLPILRNSIGKIQSTNDTIYEVSLHAGLFAIMDIGSNPTRLINADYFVGPALAARKDQWDYLIRISHTSSHLGDEFLLSPQGKKIKRINLSYEKIESIVAYRCTHNFRPYVGVGYIFHAEPRSFVSPELIMGVDYRAETGLLNDYIKPIYGIYSKTSKNSNWNPSLSLKGGLELKDKVLLGRAVEVLLEYYNGNSIHGQFYKTKESYIGASFSLHF